MLQYKGVVSVVVAKLATTTVAISGYCSSSRAATVVAVDSGAARERASAGTGTVAWGSSSGSR